MTALAQAILAFFGAGNAISTMTTFVAYLGTVSFIGTTGMAVVQALKGLLPIREVYQRIRVRTWIRKHIAKVQGLAVPPAAVTREPPDRVRREDAERSGVLRASAVTHPHHSGAVAPAGEMLTDIVPETTTIHAAGRSMRYGAAPDMLFDSRTDAPTRLKRVDIALTNTRERRHIDQLTPGWKVVETDLVALAVDGDEAALYSLEPEQMTAQLKMAFQMALAEPKRHAALLEIAGAWADNADLLCVTTDPGPTNEARLQYADARSRVGQQLQRAVDALGISVSFRWESLMHLLAFAVCLGITALIVRLGTGSVSRTTLGPLFITGLLAAFLAPLARDVVAAIGTLRS